MPVVEDVLSNSLNGFAHFAFSRNGTLVFVPGDASRQTLQWIDNSGQSHPVGVSAEYYGPIRLSPDGKQLAVGSIERGDMNIGIYDWARNAMAHLTFTSGFNGHPVWSPDGKHLVFSSKGGDRPVWSWRRLFGRQTKALV